MQRPPLEVADIVRAAGKKFIENSREWITAHHLKVLRAIVRCRTAALGWHVDQCTRCGYSGHSYNSCRDRHCPKCQANARLRWITGRKKELLPVPYAHIVFTVPRLLAKLALQNKQLIYTILLRLSAETLIEVARNPKRLGAEIGFWSTIHTCTASFPPEDCRSTVSAGWLPIHAIDSFCRSRCCDGSFEERSRML
jgi:predicted Zn-ribbon and HTH transcriptional regulator